MKKILFILFVTLSMNIYSSGPPGPPGGWPSDWCANKPPNHPCHANGGPNNGVPINGGIEFLALAGMLLIVYYKYKK